MQVRPAAFRNGDPGRTASQSIGSASCAPKWYHGRDAWATEASRPNPLRTRLIWSSLSAVCVAGTGTGQSGSFPLNIRKDELKISGALPHACGRSIMHPMRRCRSRRVWVRRNDRRLVERIRSCPGFLKSQGPPVTRADSLCCD